MSNDRSYEDDEVRAIIERALRAQPEGKVSHEDLLSIGAGVGLSSEAIERAARDVQEARLRVAAKASVVARRRRAVAIHGFVFLTVNACLFAVNFLTTPGEWWCLFSIFGWGLGLLLHVGLGLFAGVSPRRLERARLGVATPSASASAESRRGVRVEASLAERVPSNEPEAPIRRRS